jgi:hypothetical protein
MRVYDKHQDSAIRIDVRRNTARQLWASDTRRPKIAFLPKVIAKNKASGVIPEAASRGRMVVRSLQAAANQANDSHQTSSEQTKRARFRDR